MNTKKYLSSLLIGVISTAICFNFGFLTNVLSGGIDFIVAYIVLSLLICYPTNLVFIYFAKAYPDLNTHSKVTKHLTSSNKLKTFSILLTIALLILSILTILNILPSSNIFIKTTVITNNTNLLSYNLAPYSVVFLFIIFIIAILIVIFSNVRNINLSGSALKMLSYISLVLIIISLIFTVYTLYQSHDFQSITALISSKLYLSSESADFNKILNMALVYAILSNFITLAFYKNTVGLIDENLKKLRFKSFNSIVFNIIFTLALCFVILMMLSNWHTNWIIYNILYQALFKLFGFIFIIIFIKHILEFKGSIYFKSTILIIPFILSGIFMYKGSHLVFSKLFGLHFLIIYLFLFDIFLVGWVYDAQKLSYQILKNTDTKLSPLFNIMLRIVIPLICLYVAIGYIFSLTTYTISWQLNLIIAIIFTIIYIIKGIIFSNIFNKRSSNVL